MTIMSSTELLQKACPANPVKESLHIKAFFLQILKVYALPKDKPVFNENLNGIYNVVDDGNVGDLFFLGGVIVHRFLKRRKPEKVLKFYKFSNDDLRKHKYL